MAEDLRRRGELDLPECLIDGAFMVAKKGAAKSERPGGARGLREWQTLPVSLSPPTLNLLARMGSPL